MSGGTLQYTQAGVAGLTGSQEFVTAAGASQQYTYPTSLPQQSPASPQHQPQQNPGSPRSPGGQHQPLPSPTHQQGQQPPQAMPSPTHTSMLPPSTGPALSLSATATSTAAKSTTSTTSQQQNSRYYSHR